MPAPPSLAFDGVTKVYGAVRAVDGVTLTIPPGQFVALVGTSGSGKSTLLKTVNRLVVPDAGSVMIDGADVANDAPHRLRRRVGYVFQNIGLFPHLSVGENIAIAERLGAPPVDIAAALERVELPADIASRMPDQLSGGQRQRVGVARALAGDARLLLMDEPFGALDPVTRDALARRVRALHERIGLTTVLVTHDMAEALLLADRVLVMAAGKIVADATPAELMTGQAGDAADALVAVPREQAHALAALEKRA
ncbi:ATP-binding cassette domain-containing protein [Sphingomonas sp.]|uniref:ATP-binding cassette domain-containing protein n=1 Tax=Sphingomonas sp. TaxID=28214 RepID=UPI002B70B0BD|nr:ATP-binding cassette domain-containing protein [Sphingomonas sp.]HTG38794.1 ATP-binding cassette domain-containing protein [Sphingomonas sp.]